MLDDAFVRFIVGLIAVVVLGTLLLISNLFFTTETVAQGSVISKSYESERMSTGTGVSGSGKPVVISSYEPEKWIVIVDVNGSIMPANISPAEWAKACEHSPVDVRVNVGWMGLINGRTASLRKPLQSGEPFNDPICGNAVPHK